MNSNQPLVSVIIPSYNHEKFVEQTIESIVHQTYKNIELLVIDDGSTDRSPIILEELSKKYAFYFEKQENKGICHTANKLISKARGKYVMHTASDDYYSLDRIEKQVKFLEEHEEFAVCSGNCVYVDEKNEPLPNRYQFQKKYAEWSFKDIIQENLVGAMPMVRLDALKKFPYTQEYKLEDWYLWLKITRAGHKIAFLPDVLGYYRVHPNNTTKRNKHMLQMKLELLNSYRHAKGYRKAVAKAYVHYYMHVILGLVPSVLLPFKRN